jgi:uncharacterized protein (DUF885 family)
MNKHLSFLLLNSFVFLIPVSAQSPYEKHCEARIKTQAQHSESQRFAEFLKFNWKYQMEDNPEWATWVGYPGQNDRWTDMSLSSIERRKKDRLCSQKWLKSIDSKKLNANDQLSYAIYAYDLEMGIKGDAFPSEFLPINQLGGVQSSVAQTLDIAPTLNLKDFKDILKRLEAVPELVDQNIELMKEGLKRKLTPPKITMTEVPAQVLAQIVEDPFKSPMLLPLSRFPQSVSEGEKEKIKSEASKVYLEKVVPAYKKLHDYLVKIYIPACRQTLALSELPNGVAWYNYNASRETTTNLSADEIHKLGLSEVARIREQMEKLIRSTGFRGSFKDFSYFLRTDSRFYFSKKEDLLKEYRDIAKRIDPELVKLFGVLPRLPYGVKPVPDYDEKSQTTAYYNGGSLESGRAGYFFANTYNLKTRPKWEMEALTAHEAMPGHHLQISLAQEKADLPEFRKNGGYTAYVEGWGLYSESLGEELGLYKDTYSKFGQLTYEIWRAIRLVVDTGIHSKGWTREQAIKYFMENSSKSEHDVTVEVDRYIVWPGQALAYKIGELKIKELRKMAQEQLGEKFDIRAFHDELLGGGSLPLNVLEENMKKWLARVKKQSKRS